MPKDPNEIGACWIKTSARGEFMTGNIEGIGPVVMFRNDRKTGNQPDWRILKAKPREQDSRPQARLDDRAPIEPRPSRVDDIDDSIPF